MHTSLLTGRSDTRERLEIQLREINQTKAKRIYHTAMKESWTSVRFHNDTYIKSIKRITTGFRITRWKNVHFQLRLKRMSHTGWLKKVQQLTFLSHPVVLKWIGAHGSPNWVPEQSGLHYTYWLFFLLFLMVKMVLSFSLYLRLHQQKNTNK